MSRTIIDPEPFFAMLIRDIAEYAAKQGLKPTTAALADGLSLKGYFILRGALADLEHLALIKRHGKEEHWTWSVTEAGQRFCNEWIYGK